MTMQKLKNITNKLIANTAKETNQKQKDLQGALIESGRNTQITQNHFNEHQAVELADEVSKCWIMQKTYGKVTEEDVETMVDLIIDDFGTYQPQQIIDAVREYRFTEKEFITTKGLADILNPQPKFDYAVYQRLANKSKTNPENMKDKEWKYLDNYEADALKGL